MALGHPNIFGETKSMVFNHHPAVSPHLKSPCETMEEVSPGAESPWPRWNWIVKKSCHVQLAVIKQI